ncbi:MAG: hypothetical protein JWL84_591 [Rhodospirillales bacterium]|nr:hypothetical protein [Rhodospirillales bacterium]
MRTETLDVYQLAKRMGSGFRFGAGVETDADERRKQSLVTTLRDLADRIDGGTVALCAATSIATVDRDDFATRTLIIEYAEKDTP